MHIKVNLFILNLWFNLKYNFRKDLQIKMSVRE